MEGGKRRWILQKGGVEKKKNCHRHLGLKWLLFSALKTIGPISVAVTWRAWHCQATDVQLSRANTHQSHLN